MKTTKENNNVLMTINVHNAQDELVSIPIPTDYKGELDNNKYPRVKIDEYDSYILLRISSMEELSAIIANEGFDFLHEADGCQLFNEEFWDEEIDEYRPMSGEEVVKGALESFKKFGCCYRYITYNDCIFGDKEVKIVEKGSRVVTNSAEVFTAKYGVGTNCFYHAKSSEDIKASKIDTIIVTHKCGYNSTTEYMMKDGARVTENNVLMKDKALEWVESRG